MSSDEKELLEKAKKGDVGSFETLIESSKKRAFNIAFHLLRNEEDAKDALQESFIKIFKSINSFKGESSFNTWVYRIVSNTCSDMLRKNNKYQYTDNVYIDKDNEEQIVEIKDLSLNPEEMAQRKERLHYILNCLDRLSHEHREVIILRDIRGFSYEEISQILRCSDGTVKSRINRARNNLKQMMLLSTEQT